VTGLAEKRGMFQSIFGQKQPEDTRDYTAFRLLSTWQSQFSPFSGNAWDINAVRAAVDAFARNAAKVTPRHIRKGGDGAVEEVRSDFNRLLQYQPNPYMTAYAFYYRVATQYMMNNNAFIYPVVEMGKIVAFYPINATTIELLEYEGEMYYGFRFIEKRYICHRSEVIHIRRHFFDNDIFGSNNKPILPVLNTANTFNQSMSKFAELVALIRGILKINGAPKTTDLNKRRDDFIKDNLKIENNGSGIIVTDSMYDYTPIDSKQTPIPAGQLDYIRRETFDYWGTNEAIVQNKATPEQWTSYYEGEIEPFFIQLTQGFTNCCFSAKERGFGNEIIHKSNRLQFASLKDKISASKFIAEIGAADVDMILEIFNMLPIGGKEGKRRIQTLNVVNADIADEYQLGKVNVDSDDKTDEPPPDKTEEEI